MNESGIFLYTIYTSPSAYQLCNSIHIRISRTDLCFERREPFQQFCPSSIFDLLISDNQPTHLLAKMAAMLADIDATCASLGYYDGTNYIPEKDSLQCLKVSVRISSRH